MVSFKCVYLISEKTIPYVPEYDSEGKEIGAKKTPFPEMKVEKGKCKIDLDAGKVRMNSLTLYAMWKKQIKGMLDGTYELKCKDPMNHKWKNLVAISHDWTIYCKHCVQEDIPRI